MSNVCAVVGGQFGSEGKGLIAAHIAQQYKTHVRVGAANAGHTFYVEGQNRANGERSWEKHVMQQLPCAAYAHPGADLVIGPGAIISHGIFCAELAKLNDWRKARGMGGAVIALDHRAHVITPYQIEREQESDLAERIGSTSATAKEGIGTAQAERVMRDSRCQLAGDTAWPVGVIVGDTAHFLSPQYTDSEGILLEGTQGTGLSLTTGFFPYVTSRNTTVAGLCADSGVAPTRVDRVILVCRTFPIRVAGNSGPFGPGSEEISWEDIAVDSEKERTTVTKKVRRVATFSMEQVKEACILNGATEIALTFADYLEPKIYGQNSIDPDQISGGKLDQLFEQIEQETGVPVRFIGTGPKTVVEVGA